MKKKENGGKKSISKLFIIVLLVNYIGAFILLMYTEETTEQFWLLILWPPFYHFSSFFKALAEKTSEFLTFLFATPVYIVNDNPKKNDSNVSTQQQMIRELILENKKDQELIKFLKEENESLKSQITEILKKI